MTEFCDFENSYICCLYTKIKFPFSEVYLRFLDFISILFNPPTKSGGQKQTIIALEFRGNSSSLQILQGFRETGCLNISSSYERFRAHLTPSPKAGFSVQYPRHEAGYSLSYAVGEDMLHIF